MLALVQTRAIDRDSCAARHQAQKQNVFAIEFALTLRADVDDADEVVREAALPVPGGEHLPWAVGVARRDSGLIPILDLDALGDRIG